MARWLLCLLPWSAGVEAGVFVFGADAATERQGIAAIDGGGQVRASESRFVLGNAFAVDTAGDRLYFAERNGSGSRISMMPYRASSVQGSIVTLFDLPFSRVTHLAFDAAPVSRLLVAVRRNSDQALVIYPFTVPTISLGPEVVIPDAPQLGVSAYRSSDDRWFLVSGGNPQELLGVSVDTGVVSRWVVPGGSRIGALVVHPATQVLWGLVDEAAEGGTRVATLSPGGTLVITPIGSASPTCCFVLGGPAAIDPAANQLMALTRDRSGVVPLRPIVTSFDLGSGLRLLEAEVPGNGLFHDPGLVLPELFLDGFE